MSSGFFLPCEEFLLDSGLASDHETDSQFGSESSFEPDSRSNLGFFPTPDVMSDWNLSADYIELTAYFSEASEAFFSVLIHAMQISTEQDRVNISSEVSVREEIASETREVIRRRAELLGDVYPFSLGKGEDSLLYTGPGTSSLSLSHACSLGQTSYMLSLVLSNLPPVGQVLDTNRVKVDKREIMKIRKYFQYIATAALAGEISGSAWSFGFPRLDGAKFQDALREVWRTLRDGEVNSSLVDSKITKDDKIDVIAARTHSDGYPGYLLAVGQVATGRNWKDSSIIEYVVRGGDFRTKWFLPQPVTDFICYNIVPFTFAYFTEAERFEFSNLCLDLGNILHRLRIPYRVKEACLLHKEGKISIQEVDKLNEVVDWIKQYKERGRGI